ncbi:MAG TPA: acyl-CoA dehydrogenase family protein, partial [Acidimicrobiales bacterium]
MLDLTFSDEQEMLRDVVRRLCTERSSPGVVRAMEDDPAGFPADLWDRLAQLDLLGLAIPAEYGGSGMSALEGAVLYEELGRALAPVPHFVSCVVSACAITVGGSHGHRTEWLPRIASGEAIVVPAWLEPGGGAGPRGVRLRAAPEGDGFTLTGTKRHVAFASAATRLLVLARTGDAPATIDLFLVDPAAPGVELTQQMSIASDTQYRVDLDRVPVTPAERLGAAGTGWSTWEAVRDDALIVLAAWAVGAATAT